MTFALQLRHSHRRLLGQSAYKVSCQGTLAVFELFKRTLIAAISVWLVNFTLQFFA